MVRDTCMVLYMHCGFIKLYEHDFEVIKYISYVTCTISAYNYLVVEPVALGLGDYKPDIARGMT